MKTSFTNVKKYQNVSRVIAFGDSFTYGQGLRDCFVPWTDTNPSMAKPFPSKLAYPSLLANSLNIPVLNVSFPGASNREILHRISTFDFNSNDLVIVGWSFISREIYLDETNKKSVLKVGPWSSEELMKDTGYSFRNQSEMTSRGVEPILLGYYYLLSKGLHPICFNFSNTTFQEILSNQTHSSFKSSNKYISSILSSYWNQLTTILNFQQKFNYSYNLSHKYNDWALDSEDPHYRIGHPGERTHKAMTGAILKLLDVELI